MMRRRCGRLAVYVTSHGFGHLNRTVAVLNQVPPSVPITIRCHPNLWDHWGERMRRPAEFQSHLSDAGAINPPGDSAATDGPATLAAAIRVHRDALLRVDEFSREINSDDTAAVLCDVTPVPLVAARRMGVPGFLLANFTWADIYEPHARALGGDAPAFVRELRAAYRQATALFRAEPALAMRWLRVQIPVGIVATRGQKRQAELRRLIGASSKEKLVYFYVGRYGQDTMDWERVARLATRGLQFVGFHPAPIGPLPNLHIVSAHEWTGADLAASADVIVAKAGYGSTCEAMVAGTPLIYPPRAGFAEHRALDRALRAWGGGVPAPRIQFDTFHLETQIVRALALRPGPPPFPTDGARRVADHLTRLCQGLAVA